MVVVSGSGGRTDMKRKPHPNSLKNLKPPRKKGDPPLNPKGINNPELQLLRKITATELKEIGNLLLRGDVEGVRKISKDSKVNYFKGLLASLAIKAYDSGDPAKIETLFSRLIGKVKDEIEVTGDHLAAATVVILPPKNG